MQTFSIKDIEEQIDSFLYDQLDDKIPRNKLIYHCNLAFIDIVVDQKLLFTVMEKHYLFSLSYITYLAHKKLHEEDTFDFQFDPSIYKYALVLLVKGMQYSLLCDIFPLLHSGKASMATNKQNEIEFKISHIPRKNYKFIGDYTIRKALSYTLQMANGMLSSEDDEDIAMKLSEVYTHFWNENMMYEDFEPYTRLDYGGITYFFILASMRRFNKIYKNDFDIVKTDSQKMMIILSPNGVDKLREYVPNCSEEVYQKALNDNIYIPLGRNLFPKLSISDAPLNKTKDGYMFANPLVVLFSNSYETRYLNYLRKADHPRHQRTKDRIKERAIPLIAEMVKYKFPDAIVISNFNALIPNTKKQKRECDILIVDNSGYTIYIEMKHFYYPISYSETKSLDSEFKAALKKMPKQLDAIRNSWELLKKSHNFNVDLTELKGIIASHQYIGYDVPIDSLIPIISNSNLFESISESKEIKDIYLGCKEIDDIYPNIKFISRKFRMEYAGHYFKFDLECLDPEFEINFIKSYRKQIISSVNVGEHKKFDNIPELAKAYMQVMEGK